MYIDYKADQRKNLIRHAQRLHTTRGASKQANSQYRRHLNFQEWSEREVFLPFLLTNVLRATTACTFSTSELPKVVRSWCVLYILTWKCASHHNGVHFFDISTSKSGLRMVCFDLDMCFAPQWRAIFHLSSGQLAPRPLDPPEPQIIG